MDLMVINYFFLVKRLWIFVASGHSSDFAWDVDSNENFKNRLADAFLCRKLLD